MKKRRARRAAAAKKSKARAPRENKGGARAAKNRSADRSAISTRGIHLSISQVAEEFGHDRATIAKRIRELGIQPAEKRQGYDVYRLRDLLALERQQEGGIVDPERLTPFEQAAYYKAVNERLKAAREIEDTCLREDVEAELARIWRLWTHGLDVLTDEIERDIGAPAAVLEALEAKLDTMREGLYAGIVDGTDTAAGEDAAAVPESTGDLPQRRGDPEAAEAHPAE